MKQKLNKVSIKELYLERDKLVKFLHHSKSEKSFKSLLKTINLIVSEIETRPDKLF